MKTLCAVATDVNRVEVGAYDIRDPLPGELLIETLFSAVSPGTELRCLAGKEPHAGPFPMITGYSLVGKVLRGDEAIGSGDLVFAPGAAVVPEGVSRSWGGHIGHAIVPAASALRLAAGVDVLSASALAMLSIALHGVSRSRPSAGDRVMVAGLGLIGQMATMLFKLMGCQVAVCDPLADRPAFQVLLPPLCLPRGRPQEFPLLTSFSCQP